MIDAEPVLSVFGNSFLSVSHLIGNLLNVYLDLPDPYEQIHRSHSACSSNF